MAKLTEERIELALKLRKEGHTLEEVGQQIGVSKARAGYICSSGPRRLEQIRTDPFYTLSAMGTYSSVFHPFASWANYKGASPEIVREWITSGELHTKGQRVIFRGEEQYGYGLKGFRGLCHWLGLEEYAAVETKPSDIAIKRAIAVLIKAGYKPLTK